MPSGDNPKSRKNLKLGHGWNKGMSKSNGDNLSYGKPRSETTKQLISQSLKGKTKSLKHRQNLSKSRLDLFDKLGRKIPRSAKWDGRYQRWRRAVLERDNYTCQYCGIYEEHLHTHHIFKFIDYPELRYNVENGLTLCGKCHRKTENYGVKKCITRK